MKKSLFLLAMLLSLAATTWAQEYDFTATVGTKTLYFKILTTDNYNSEKKYLYVGSPQQ